MENRAVVARSWGEKQSGLLFNGFRVSIWGSTKIILVLVWVMQGCDQTVNKEADRKCALYEHGAKENYS